MSHLIDTHFDFLCRLCAYQCNSMNMMSIFSKEAHLRAIQTKIESCLSLNIQEIDKLPKAICENCLYKLDLLFDFRNKCLESEQYFIEIIKQTSKSSIFLISDENLQNYDSSQFSNTALSETMEINSNHVLSAADSGLLEAIVINENDLVSQEQVFDVIDFRKHINVESNDIRFDSADCEDFEKTVTNQFESKNQLNENILIENITYNSDLEELNRDIEEVEKESYNTFQSCNIYQDEVEKNFTEEQEFEIIVKKKKLKKSNVKVCEICQKNFKTNFKLNQHQKTHTGEKPFLCPVENCGKKFKSKMGLIEHEAKHSGKYAYFCRICHKGFNNKSYLDLHQRVHSTSKDFKCSTCGTCLKSKAALIDHVHRHLGVKPFECTNCKQKFTTKSSLEKHEATHTGTDKIFPCTICNKKFVSKYYLTTHIRIHTNDRKFVCQICSKGFLTSVDLKVHGPTHTGTKEYVCEICGKAFARRDTLILHRRVHTGEKPYECEFCDQTFSQYTPMVIHKRTHTGERPYPCKSCAKAFVSKSSLVLHTKRHHA